MVFVTFGVSDVLVYVYVYVYVLRLLFKIRTYSGDTQTSMKV